MNKNIILMSICLSYTLNANETVNTYDLPIIEVKEDSIDSTNAWIENGFLNESKKIGPLNSKKMINIPYQINSIPKELIEDQQASGFEDIIKFSPSAQIEYRGGAELGRPQTRGFQGHVVSNTFWDGFHTVSTTAIPMAQFENVQILNGLAGSLFGAQTPSGIYDFTLKRPTKKKIKEIYLKYNENSNIELGADISGIEGVIGYRGNLVLSDGEGYVNNSDLEKELYSLGLDFYLTQKAKIETNFSEYKYKKEGFAGTFTMPILSGGTSRYNLPDAVKNDTEGLGQEYAGMDLETKTASIKLKYDITDNWYFEGGYLFQKADRAMYGVTNTFIDDNGGYNASQARSTAASRFDLGSWIAKLQTSFDIFNTKHNLSLGGNGYRWETYSNKYRISPATLGISNIKSPTVFSNPGGFSGKKNLYKSGQYDVNSITLVDNIEFSPKFESIFSVSENWIEQKSYDSSENRTAKYSKNDESYAISLIYKPLQNFSIYTTYADSIEQGASGENADHTTVVLEPERSKQYELGLKTKLGNFDLSSAIFQIKRPLAYQDTDGTFKKQGEQKNRGLEVMLTGKLTDDLALYGGFTYLDPKLQETKYSSTSDKQVIGVPKFQANIYLDYQLPIKEWSINTNVHYTAKRPIDQTNDQWAKKYYTVDLGMKYISKKFIGKKTTFRFNINNLFDEEYWASVFPRTGIDGDGSAGGVALFLGESRNFTASMQISF